VRILSAQDFKDFQSRRPGHLLIQENQVVGVFAKEGQTVVSIGDGVDVVPSLLEE
jgi:hypothetical protein